LASLSKNLAELRQIGEDLKPYLERFQLIEAFVEQKKSMEAQ
jgi:hypothetical protein